MRAIVANQSHIKAAFSVSMQASCPKLRIANIQKAQVNGCGLSGFEFLLHYHLGDFGLVILNSLCFSFLIHNTGMIIIFTSYKCF